MGCAKRIAKVEPMLWWRHSLLQILSMGVSNLLFFKGPMCLFLTGVSDIFNGLLVVADLLKKASEHRLLKEKHCLLVSNFACEVREGIRCSASSSRLPGSCPHHGRFLSLLMCHVLCAFPLASVSYRCLF